MAEWTKDEEIASLTAERDFYQHQAQTYRKGWLSRGRMINGTGEFALSGPMHEHETVVNLRIALHRAEAERIALADAARRFLSDAGANPVEAAHLVQDIIDNAAPLRDGVCSDG